MGLTHHQHGADVVEYISNMVLLHGMVGRRSAGPIRLREHSNVQGISTVGGKPVLAEGVLARMKGDTLRAHELRSKTPAFKSTLVWAEDRDMSNRTIVQEVQANPSTQCAR